MDVSNNISPSQRSEKDVHINAIEFTFLNNTSESDRVHRQDVPISITIIEELTYLFSTPENRGLVLVGVKYVLVYAAVALVGTYIAVLLFEGFDTLKQYFLLSTVTPISIAIPIAAHGVYNRINALKLSGRFKFLLDHDELTGLMSRRYVFHQLKKAPAQYNFILMIDMDRLKHLNDTHGHSAGDAALKFLADVLLASTVDGDVAGRLSGDEFIVLSGLACEEDVSLLAHNILGDLYRANVLDDGSNPFTICIGIAKLEQNECPSQAIQNADTALYIAKKEGGNCVRFETVTSP